MGIKSKLGENLYSQLLSDSCVVKGNSTQLKKAFSQEKIRIGFIGGSVTYGYFPDGTPRINGFTYCLEKSLNDKFPQKDFEFLNLGISGTACLMGIILSEYKLRQFSPDIVIVEYALNETISPDGVERFESLITKLLSFEKPPAIVLVSAFCENGYTCEEFINELARHYKFFAIGLKNAMTPLLENNQIQWSDYSCDEGHPNSDGHILISDCLVRLIDIALKGENVECEDFVKPMFSQRFSNLKLLEDSFGEKSKENFYGFENCFEIHSDKIFKQNFKNLVIVYIANNSDSFTNCDITIDSKKVAILQGYSIFGWNNPVAQLVAKYDENAVHTVKITPHNKDKRFVICAIGY